MRLTREKLYECGSSKPYYRYINVRDQYELTDLERAMLSQVLDVPPEQIMSEANKSAGGILTPTFKLAERNTAPIPPVPANPREPEVPNKIAQVNLKWGNKVAWSSKDLLKRQKSLETYSAELEMMYEALIAVLVKLMQKRPKPADMAFSANFGSPIRDNAQTISIIMTKPIALSVMLTRELVDERLRWSADVTVRKDTPATIDVQKGNGALPVVMTPMDTATESMGPQGERRRRKVKL